MIKINFSDLTSLTSKVQAGNKQIKRFKQALQHTLKKQMNEDETIAYFLEQINALIMLNKELKKYVEDHTASIMNPVRSSGREALAQEIEKVFSQASQIDAGKINITNDPAYEMAEAFLKIFDMSQSLFPDHTDEHLIRAQQILKEKMKAYTSMHDADEQSVENNVRIYMPSEPTSFIKTLSSLEQYIDDELASIAKTDDLNIKLAGYNLLTKLTAQACEMQREALHDDETDKMVSWQDRFKRLLPINAPNERVFDQPHVDALMGKISAAHDATMEELTQAIGDNIQAYQELMDNFKDVMHIPPQLKYKTKMEEEANEFIRGLTTALDMLKETKNMNAFKAKAELLFDDFSKKLVPLGATGSWFQTYIVEPFEQLKEKMKALIHLVYKKIPNHTSSQPRFFNNKSVQRTEPIEKEKQDLEPLDDQSSQIKPGG